MSPSAFKPDSRRDTNIVPGSGDLPCYKFARTKSDARHSLRGSTLDSIKRNSLSRSSDDVSKQNTKISSIIGDFGPYQIAVLAFAALRAMCCSMDGLSGPFLSPSVRTFACTDNYSRDINKQSLPSSLSNNATATSSIMLPTGSTFDSSAEINQCFFKARDTQQLLPCKHWSFDFEQNKPYMSTLSVEQSLVCENEWLKSLSNSLYFVGATLGLLFWGFISDKYGRKTAYVYSHFVTLTFGFASLFATDMRTYIILRMLNSFGMIGELVPRSIVVEIVAAKYRFICSVVCQTGWACGIILVPLLSYANPSYRFILTVPVVLSVVMLPWLYFLPESARWLIINNKFERAHNELIRASKINGKFSDQTATLILKFNHQVLREEQATTIVGTTANGEHAPEAKRRLGIMRSLFTIFTNARLFRNTMSVFLLLFVAEVVYFSLTLNVADLGGSMHLNYIISGFSEFISIALCGFMLACFSRRMCLSLLLLLSTVSYLLMAVVNVYEHSLPMLLILGVNAFGKITAIGNLMVIILVSQEVFPTVIRQFGTSLCITVGKAGSAVAPFTHELGQSIGHSYCFTMFSLICFACAFVPAGLSETGSCELPDTVVDIEKGGDRKQKGASIKTNGKQAPNAKQVDEIVKVVDGFPVMLQLTEKPTDDDPNNNDASETVTNLNEKSV